MAYQLDLLELSRKNFVRLLDNYSIDQINKIPEGFSNNLIWNFGHVVVVQQLLQYGLSGLELVVDQNLVQKYKKGSAPESYVNQEEYELLKSISIKAVAKLRVDLETEVFKEFSPYKTSFGNEMTNINEAIEFNNMHETMHFGTILALRKFV